MNWEAFIDSDPSILVGKPIIKGTRISIEFILELFAKGWDKEQILENYPQLTPDAIRAVFSYISEALHDEAIYLRKKALLKMRYLADENYLRFIPNNPLESADILLSYFSNKIINFNKAFTVVEKEYIRQRSI